MNKKRVSVIFGGQSPEHPASLESFRYVLSAFEKESHGLEIEYIVYLDRSNMASIHEYKENNPSEYYMRAENSMVFVEAVEFLMDKDSYIINLLHGSYGEDGHIQGVAKYAGIKGTFGDVLPASLAMSKFHMSGYVAGSHSNLKIPRTVLIPDNKIKDCPEIISREFKGQKMVVKPNSLGASLFTELYSINNATTEDIYNNIEEIFQYDRFALAQEYVEGVEYSVGCIKHFGETVTLPPVLIDTDRRFFGHSEKHEADKVRELIVDEKDTTTEFLKKVSEEIFEAVGFETMCRFDYIVSADSEFYFLEANPIPGLMRNSIFPRMLRHEGITIPMLIQGFMESLSIENKKTFVDYSIA